MTTMTKLLRLFRQSIFMAIYFSASLHSSAQVKIGGSPSTPINASSVLHIDDSTKGFLMPVMNQASRDAITSPAEGLIIYNKTTNKINLFSNGNWQSLNTDTSEWRFDTTGQKRVYLTRGITNADSIYYDTSIHKFIFADRRTYTNSLNQDFPSEALGGRYTFKTTASRNVDSAHRALSALTAVYEIDNDIPSPFSQYSAINSIATANPKALQKIGVIRGINNNTLNAGNDTAFQMTGLNNFMINRSLGHTSTTIGIQNNFFIASPNTGNFGTVYGISNNASYQTGSTGRIQGNYYGYFSQFASSFASQIDGTSYGIFLNNNAGAAGGNYAIYTNAGRNRFGDSVLIGTGIIPRAFVDINNTTSMIIPTGTTAQRPAIGVVGMTRFNSEHGGYIESFNGSQWVGIIRSTLSIDIPSLTAGSSFTTSLPVSGATIGSSVSISPTNALATGLVIAYARVSAANTVEVRFTLLAGSPNVDPAAENYYIRVMQ